jgi:hypothetical protein
VKKVFLWMIAALMFASFVAADENESVDASPNTPSWLQKASKSAHVEIVFETRAGERKVSRVPYSFEMITDSPQGAVFRVGTEVPIAVSKQVKEGERTDWQYRNVGTNVRCSVRTLGNGRYLLTVNFEQSSIHAAESKDSGVHAPGVPLFNTWSLMSDLVVHDGQTVHSALGSDPNTGETATLDITMKLMK